MKFIYLNCGYRNVFVGFFNECKFWCVQIVVAKTKTPESKDQRPVNEDPNMNPLFSLFDLIL